MMPLPTPNLDDRRFQDLVDDAKRLVQQRCPEWTDHNVSDPGVTLIETFASMVDQLLYRLNRVPAANYLRFLDLIGLKLFPPSAARCLVTFWLSAAQAEPVAVPAGAQVSTPRTDTDEALVFTTVSGLSIVPCELALVFTELTGAAPIDRTDQLEQGFSAFGAQPAPGDALLFGLSDPVPACTVLLRMDCSVEGIGVDPRDPPLVWEAWDGSSWRACDLDIDETGGLNRPGDVIVHLPATHSASVVSRRRAGWLRCRVLEPAPGQPFYTASPRVRSVRASTVGGSVPAVHADVVRDEVVGLSEGVPGQQFRLQHRPIVAGDDPVVMEVAGGGGWQEWVEVGSFTDSQPGDQHFQLDRGDGVLQLGPAVREPDGSLRHYGAVPPKGVPMRVREYRTGGGKRGNVARGQLSVQRRPIPYISRVENRRPAQGGLDGETIDNAALRGPLLLRTRDRAVTAVDYEQLALAAAPGVARVRCVPAGTDPAPDVAGLRVLVVPAAHAAPDELAFADLKPSEELLAHVAGYLDERRCLGARVVVEPPFYQGVTVVAKLQARPRTAPEGLRDRATRELYRYLNPLSGGTDGAGWPFGRPVHSGEVFAVLQKLPGVELVEDVRLFGADPLTGERGAAVARLDLPAHALVFSYAHQVLVVGRGG